jgi:hypothetical protein
MKMAAHEGAAGDRFGNHTDNDSNTISPTPPQITDRSLVKVLRVIWWGQVRDGHRMPAEKGVILLEFPYKEGKDDG